MKQRNRLDSFKVLKVSAEGNIMSQNITLPTKNQFAKVKQEAYSPENREKYRQFSKTIADKVSKYKDSEKRSRELELLVRKNSARVIANSLNKVIANSKD